MTTTWEQVARGEFILMASGHEADSSERTVWVVRDASGEYLGADGERTPASDEAAEFETRDEARTACARATDRVLSREVE